VNKIKKAAAVAAMVGGMGLLGGGLAHADGQGRSEPEFNNPQAQTCPVANSLINANVLSGLSLIGNGTANAGSPSQPCLQTGQNFGK
jgi:hypothetical protein